MWALSPKLGLSLGYRFLNVDDTDIEDTLSTDSFELSTEQHVVELGVTFGF